MTCRRAFSLFFSLLFRRKAFFFQTFVSVDFSNLIYVCTRMLSLSIYRKHTKARRNQPCTNQQRNYVPTRARQRKQADRVDEREHVVEHLHSSLRSQNERRNRNLPGKNIQPLTRQQLKLVWRANNSPLFPISRKYKTTFFSPSFLCISYMHAASWLFSWSMELCQPSGAGTISWKVSVVATTRVSRSLLTAFRILIRISKICFSIFFPDFLCWTYCGSDYSLA